MALLESIKIVSGTPASQFSLRGIDDKIYTLDSFKDAKVLVVVFMCNHCPYVQAIWGRLVSLQERFKADGVQFVGINPNVANKGYEEETFEMMKEYANRYKMNFPYLVDEDQSVAREYKAQCTPDIYVYDVELKLAYHGKIEEELAPAIESILKGESVEEQKPSIGCSIKWV